MILVGSPPEAAETPAFINGTSSGLPVPIATASNIGVAKF